MNLWLRAAIATALLMAVALPVEGQEGDSPPAAPAPALRARLAWKVVEPVPAFSTRATARPIAESQAEFLEIVEEAVRQPREAVEPPQKEPSGTVVESELPPLEYRRTIRRYFELIRAQLVQKRAGQRP